MAKDDYGSSSQNSSSAELTAMENLKEAVEVFTKANLEGNDDSGKSLSATAKTIAGYFQPVHSGIAGAWTQVGDAVISLFQKTSENMQELDSALTEYISAVMEQEERERDAAAKLDAETSDFINTIGSI